MAFSEFTPDQKDSIASGGRLVGAWASIGVTRMAELTAWAHLLAESAAAILTILLVVEFVWKKVIRPICEWRGWLKSKECADADAE